MINDLVSFIQAVKEFVKADVKDLTEESGPFSVLRTDSPTFQFYSSVEQEEKLLEIEEMACYALFTDEGLVHPAVISLLKRSDMEIIRLPVQFSPCMYGLKTEKFVIPIFKD